MNNELITTTVNIEMLQALRNTVAPGLTEPEFRLFAEMCRATGLNPATKEIWAIKAGGRLQLMTGINGFLRIANSHPAFDGMETSFEWDGKQLVSCTVKVHRKDRKFPSVATAYWSEYSKPSPVWKQMPTVMLSKCAKSLAIREAFIQELGGLYTAEEMPADFAPPKHDSVMFTTDGKERVKVTPTSISVQQPSVQQPEEILFVDPTTGEIDELPNWGKPAPKKKATPTYYDISKLEGRAKEKAAAYLRDCEAKLIINDVYRAPIRLDKLTQCITEDYTDADRDETTVAAD